MDELHRVPHDAPSYQILASRPGEEVRLLSAEISEHATRPGVDLFQDGAFLGGYDFENQADCLEHLNKIIRAHIWEKGKWRDDDHITYTLNWFEKVRLLNSATVAVEKEFSFFHSPTLIKSNKMDAMFTLMAKDLMKRGKDKEDTLFRHLLSMEEEAHEGRPSPLLSQIIEKEMVAQLNLLRSMELVDFSDFTNAQSEQFKLGFSATVRYLEAHLPSCLKSVS